MVFVCERDQADSEVHLGSFFSCLDMIHRVTTQWLK